MNYIKIVLPGVWVWVCISLSFYISGLFYLINHNFNIQVIIILMLNILYAVIAAEFYYKNGSETHGLILGVVMSLTALLLDVLITVPLVEIPNGRTYHSFFASPVVWILASLNSATVYGYWKLKIQSKK